MGIHLRSVLDNWGDTVEDDWFCCRLCYLDSLREDPPDPTYEEGGAYPGGAEHDSPDFCAHCDRPVGNPLTPEGEEFVREMVAQGGSYAGELRREYGYLFVSRQMRGE